MWDEIKDWWYGSLTMTAQDGHEVTTLGPMQVSVSDVEAALASAQRAFLAGIQSSDPSSADAFEVTSHVSTSSGEVPEGISGLGDHEWDSAHFQVTLTATSPPNPENPHQQGEHWTVSFNLSPTWANVMLQEPEWLPANTGANRRYAAQTARDATVDALTKKARRITPTWRRYRAALAALTVIVAGLWLWAMLVTSPPLPVWLLSGLVVAIAAALVFNAVRGKLARPQPLGYHGSVRVDLKPRRQVEADRLNRHANARVSVVAGLIGTVVGGFLTKILGL